MSKLSILLIINFIVLKANCQIKQTFFQKLTKQDTLNLKNNSYWVNLSFGPSLTFAPRPDNIDLLVFGPTIDFTFINKNYSLGKIKAS